MPYAEVPQFFAQLSERAGVAASALQFLILTAARSGEVLGAKWHEINGNTWTVPANRMKGGVEHIVTLSLEAVTLLEALGSRSPDFSIFPGQGRSGHLSNMAMEMLMRRMNVGQFTVHGFRSAFKDWALNHTEYPDEISEEALAHVVGSTVRRAYRRGSAGGAPLWKRGHGM
jgi:integrase